MIEQRLPGPPQTDNSPIAKWYTDILRVVNRLVARPTTLKIAFTAPAAGGSTALTHELDQTKIVAASVIIKNTSDDLVPAFSTVSTDLFTYKISGTQITVTVAAGGTAVAGRAGTILIMYEG